MERGNNYISDYNFVNPEVKKLENLVRAQRQENNILYEIIKKKSKNFSENKRKKLENLRQNFKKSIQCMMKVK